MFPFTWNRQQVTEETFLCCYGNAYILVTEVEDKLFAGVILAFGS